MYRPILDVPPPQEAGLKFVKMKRFKNVGVATAMLVATVIIMFVYTACTTETSKANSPAKAPGISAPTVELKTSMRKLWEEHVMWTRNVILCIVDDVPGTEQAVKRLLQNLRCYQ